MPRWNNGAGWGEAGKWLDEYLANIPQTDECIEWPFGLSAGYGRVKRDGKLILVTWLVLEQEVGPRPGSASHIVAAHKPLVCNNQRCINPRHLRWATRSENAKDAELDGSLIKGENVRNAKLTEDDVRYIRQTDKRVGELAKEFGVSSSCISNVRSRKNWKHVA